MAAMAAILPPDSPPSARLPRNSVALAEQLADAAREVIGGYFRQPMTVDDKRDATPVTAADREAEALMRARIDDAFPGHGIIGEEFGAERADAEYLWVLDPIDGTKSFIAGNPLFGTLIALLHRGTPILGVIDMAILDERWLGVTGQPTTLNGAPVKKGPAPGAETGLASTILHTTSPDLFAGDDARAFAFLRGRVKDTHYGGDCYSYALLASGFVDLVVEAGLKPYDYCALVPVIEGAGGIITDWHGERLGLDSDGRVAAAGDSAVHAAALTALTDRGARGNA